MTFAIKPNDDPQYDKLKALMDTAFARQQFQDSVVALIHKEKSPIAQFLIQQYYLSFELANLCYYIRELTEFLSRNECRAAGIYGARKWKRQSPNAWLMDSGGSLGNMISKLNSVLPASQNTLKKVLVTYNDHRIKIVHHIFQEYSSLNEFTADAGATVAIGNVLINSIKTLRKKLEAIVARAAYDKLIKR